MFRRRFRSLGEARSHLLWLTLAFFAIGITLILQPGRYDNTPAYANLLAVFNQAVWGALYIAGSASALIAFMLHRRKVLVAFMICVVFLDAVSWWFAFDYRWVSDSGTTIVNAVNWAGYLYLLSRCIITLDDADDDAPDEIGVP